MSNLPIAKSTPAQPKLTKAQKAFVDALVTVGGNLTQAAQLLGYQGKNPGAHASNIWRSSLVREAYKAAVWEKLHRATGVAVNSLVDIAQNADSDHARLAAAGQILDRTGFKQMEEKAAGGVTINLNLGNKAQASDLHATQTIDGDAISIDNAGDNEA